MNRINSFLFALIAVVLFSQVNPAAGGEVEFRLRPDGSYETWERRAADMTPGEITALRTKIKAQIKALRAFDPTEEEFEGASMIFRHPRCLSATLTFREMKVKKRALINELQSRLDALPR